MNTSGPVPVLCIYRVVPGKEAEFKKLLAAHGPALRKAGLTPDTPDGVAKIWRSQTREGKTVFVELMHWKDETASAAAHKLPDVLAVWEPMGALTEGMEFLHLEDPELHAS